MQKLKEAGIIGEIPLKHWARNKVICTLDIINLDITIQDKPLKHITPAMESSFKIHIDALLKMKVIRTSGSRHRTMAFIVQSGTTVDPVTGEEKRGKERLVFNYKTLNDNTHKDQYSLPSINLILKKIENSRIFSKFDLRSGFHQVMMNPESVSWTAFLVPQGLYEWLVMPFGLKNAPAVFQRKMDNCFQGCQDFLVVYIDDILIFSANEELHCQHLSRMLDICQKEGLVLSPTKMKLAQVEIDFLGVIVGNRKIKLQSHIIKKIIDFNEETLTTLKGLRSFLGILNYVISHIPNLSKLLGPLYSKTSHGDRRFKPSDWAIIKEIKALVKNLPDLELPPEDSYIIIETDDCMEGWGGVCKWKKSKFDSRSTKKICAYASGKFSILKSTIDAEIYACMEALTAMKIHYLDRKEITLRTDCHAIIKFFNKTVSNKPSRVRWISFVDYITGTGVEIKFEHIEGTNNELADALSRLVHHITTKDRAFERSLSEKEYQLLQKTEASMDEIQDAPMIVKKALGRTILALCASL